MAAKRPLFVIAPLVIAKADNGSDVYLYEGVEVPDGLLEGETDRLSEAGLIGDPSEDDKPARKTAASK